MNKFWEFKALGNTGELFLYGEISDTCWFGEEVTPAQFQSELTALGNISGLEVYINSPGGDAFAGFAIYNILKRHTAHITAHIDGLAASAASVVAMAADKIIMPKNATLMIHKAWTMTAGDSAHLLSVAAELERVDGQMAQLYADRTGKSTDEIEALMEAETWMNGTEAFDMGFIDEVEENKKIAALAAPEVMARYKHPPVHTNSLDVPGHTFEATPLACPRVEKGPCNGEETQPVEDIPPKAEVVAAQKRRFLFHKKVMEEKG